ncbi:MAG: response regulator [Planctomycetes bacterium]|nr:response regulator [Planctomycetota bacterium]
MRLFFCLVTMATLVSGHVWAQTADEALLGAATRRGAAVATVLDSPRDTPAAKLAAVLTLVDLGETDVAAVVWKTLAEVELEDAIYADLAMEFGTARLMKLARLEKPAIEEVPAQFAGARAFTNRCLEAASRRALDPERLAKLIAEVNDPAAEVRKAARVELAATGIDGAKACLEALAQAEEESIRANLMLAITGLQPAANPLLVAALVDCRGHFRRDVAEMCGYLRVDEALPFLAAIVAGSEADPAVIAAATTALSKLGHTVPNDAEARALLAREIRRIERGAFDWPTNDAEEGLWWTWHDHSKPDAQNNFSGKKVHLRMIRLLVAERLSQCLLRCGVPEEHQRQLAIIYHLETWNLLSEDRAVASPILESTTAADFSGPLAAAMKRDLMGAAITCATRLGDLGDSSILISNSGRPSPLATALGHGNRTLRFAALEAIMKLAPQRSFAGASRVPKALWEFAAGAGPAQAMVASSVTLRADDWAAQLRGLGYDATPATSGRAALQAALNSPRLELVLIDSDIDRPALREIVYQLRSNERTARIPVAILSSLANLEQARRLATVDSKLLAVIRPHSDQEMQETVDRLGQRSDQLATEQQRAERAAQAIQWIGQLLEQGHPYDELLRDVRVLSETVHVPGLVEPSLSALAMAGTTGSQLALIDFASRGVNPIEMRQLAAESFATSVQRFGKQMRLDTIHQQYERYNTSESAGAETQQVLGQILDALEGKVSHASRSGG